MAGPSSNFFRFADAYQGINDPMAVVKALADMLDRQARQAQIDAAKAAGLALTQGIFADPPNGIFGYGCLESLGPGLSVGSLVYVQRARNVAAADSLLGFPACGVVVQTLSGNRVLWAALALLEVFIQGDPADVEPSATNVLWLGQAGFGAFKAPSASGAVAQQVGLRYYANPATHRTYCLIFPGAARVGL